jgi:hypothetical protein
MVRWEGSGRGLEEGGEVTMRYRQCFAVSKDKIKSAHPFEIFLLADFGRW